MKLWGGRFSKDVDAGVSEWAASIGFDKALYKEDIAGSIAHAKMLASVGIVTAGDADAITGGLSAILAEIESGAFVFSADAEDIHMNIETRLTELIGEPAKRLHTARSRNDQVATDTRLWLKTAITDGIALLHEVRSALVELAKNHTRTVMPGYTHMQHAQPVSFAFHMLAWYQMFTRDAQRLADAYARTDVMPLGSGALAGVSYDTDRGQTAGLLGFARVSANAMDAVSDRDFSIEYISAAAIAMSHLSRCCEELILWSSSEFGFVEMDDAFSTGSSIMPQKKNPDMAELVRGKSGRVYGDLMAALSVMKGLPLAYNKDMQEDKEPLFDAAETLRGCLFAFLGMVRSMDVRPDAMAAAAREGFMNATDAADYLCEKGMPFREAHETIGRLVAHCAEKGIALDALPMERLQEASPLFGEDFFGRIDLLACMNAKRSEGGTSEASVLRQIAAAEAELGAAGA